MKGHAGGKTTDEMPDRAIIPLIAATMCGFIAGLIVAVTQTYNPQATEIALIVGVFVFASGFLSVIKAAGEERERWIVGALRGAVAVACYGFLFAGIIVAVQDGRMLGIVWFALSAFFAILLTRFRVRDRGQLSEFGRRGQPTA